MQHDALEQVAERQVVVLGEALQDLEQAFFDPHAGLDALDLERGAQGSRTCDWVSSWIGIYMYICTPSSEKNGVGPHFSLEAGRGERIRTSGLYVPNVALYQAKLHPEFSASNSELPFDGKEGQL